MTKKWKIVIIAATIVTIIALCFSLLTIIFNSQGKIYKNDTDRVTFRNDGTFIYEWIFGDAIYEGTYEHGEGVYVLHMDSNNEVTGNEMTLFEMEDGNLTSNRNMIFYKQKWIW